MYRETFVKEEIRQGSDKEVSDYESNIVSVARQITTVKCQIEFVQVHFSILTGILRIKKSVFVVNSIGYT